MAGAVYHKPVGQNGGHKTPFTDIRGLQLILLSLRGKVAQQYRSMLNEIFLRYTAGDRSMIQEIEQNAISEEPLNVLARETLAVDSALEEEESVVVGRKRLVSETAEKTAQNLQLVHHNAQQAAQSVLQVNQAVQQLSQSLQLAGDGAEAYAKGINSISQATKDHQDTIKDIGFDSSGDRMMYILKVGTFVADMAPILGPAAGNSFAQAAPPPAALVAFTDIFSQVIHRQVPKTQFANAAHYVALQYKTKYNLNPAKSGNHDMYPMDCLDQAKKWLREWRNLNHL